MSENFKPVDYSWLNSVADDSGLRIKDICTIYGLKKPALHTRVSRGTFPKCDFQRYVYHGSNKTSQNYWYAKTVKQQILKDLGE